MADEMVYMRHESVDSVGGPVTRKAFERIWSKKGWTEVPADEAVSAQSASYEAEVLQVSDADLAAASSGLPLDAVVPNPTGDPPATPKATATKPAADAAKP